jgi:hypothetical protein
MPKKSVAEHSVEWRLLLDSIGTGTPEAAFLKELLFELRTVQETLLNLESERLALTARRQQITKDMNLLKNRGRTVAARVRSGLRTQLGYDSEQLTAHGMKPRRRRVGQTREELETVARLTDDSTS